MTCILAVADCWKCGSKKRLCWRQSSEVERGWRCEEMHGRFTNQNINYNVFSFLKSVRMEIREDRTNISKFRTEISKFRTKIRSSELRKVLLFVDGVGLDRARPTFANLYSRKIVSKDFLESSIGQKHEKEPPKSLAFCGRGGLFLGGTQ